VIALIIALGGTGYAAIGLPASSVENKQLKNGAVTTKRIARNAVTSAKVKRNSLNGADIRESTLAEVRNARHVADGATRAGSAKYFCTLPVTVMGRERAIEQLGLEEPAANSTNTTNSAGEAGL
jgi:hypothetical protein